MELSKKVKIALCLTLLLALTFFCVLLDLSWVSRSCSYTLSQVWDALINRASWDIIANVRNTALPRVVTGIFVGSGLAICGCAMQSVFRNPLASPYILGLSSGASLGAAFAMCFGVAFIPLALQVPVMAFITCFGTMILVYSMSKVGGTVRTESLILSGVAVSSLLSAAVSLLTFISGDNLQGIVFWSMGDLGGTEWEEILLVAPIITVCSIFLLTQAKNLNVMMLGDLHAMDLGVDVKKTRLFVLILTTLIVASAVSFVGVIGFIGLVIPHILRILLGPDNRYIMPVSLIGGACFILICDYLSRIIAPGFGILPIGVITALVGAPIFIALLMKRKKEVGWN